MAVNPVASQRDVCVCLNLPAGKIPSDWSSSVCSLVSSHSRDSLVNCSGVNMSTDVFVISWLLSLVRCMLGYAPAPCDPEQVKLFREQIDELAMAGCD